MSRDEVMASIGTIAKSGTREFLQSLTGDQRKDAAMIGQFGVGFYSSLIVADRVVLTTRRAGLEPAEGVRWESDGRGTYTLEPIDRVDRGTTVVLHLREGEDHLLNGWRLRSIIEKYSDHISVPILMPGEPEDKAEEAAGTPRPDVTVNQASALWTRPKSGLTDKDYSEFYRHIAGEFADPLAWVHTKIEGTYDYTLLLFVPSRAPYDLWVETARRGVRLHVQRVFIMEDTGQILLAPSLAAAKSSPHLEAFRTRGVEVLLLGHGVDNWVISSLGEFDGKKLQSVAQGAGDLGALADEEESRPRSRPTPSTRNCSAS
jgi:molecular chaperone HtpG